MDDWLLLPTTEPRTPDVRAPRLEQLEIEMETALRPRDIQARIRSGETVAELAEVAEMPIERIEAFATPVLAEREHVALQAQSSSVRRRGETSGHRNLRTTVTERLLGKGVDIDDVEWDAWRQEDGRWVVSVVYLIEEAERRALFHFDAKARYSVAGDDGGHWMLRDKVQTEDSDNEPTVDLSDELALVRATQADPDPDDTAPVSYSGHLSAVPDTDDVGDLIDEDTLADDLIVRDAAESDRVEDHHPEDDPAPDAAETSAESQDETAAEAEQQEEPADDARDETAEEEPAALDVLDDMLGGDGFAEDSVIVYSGLSDATAVPDTDNAGWEPAIVVDYPVQPDLLEEQPALVDLDPTEEQEDLAEARKERRTRRKRPRGRGKKSAPEAKSAEPTPETVDPETTPDEPHPTPVEPHPTPVEPHPTPVEPVETSDLDRLDPADPDKLDPADPDKLDPADPDKLDQREATPGESVETPADEPVEEEKPAPKKKPARKKRAEVPSWDEIMFGSPRNPRGDS